MSAEAGESIKPAAAAGSLDVRVLENFKDPMWRLWNLYWIIDDGGNEIHFQPNDMQQMFLRDMWYRNVISKGRQHGITTVVDLVILDNCAFYDNQTGAIIAHTLDDVKKIFRRKVKHPFDRLPAGIRDALRPSNDSANELIFANGSEISVDTSFRSGTVNFLHVSEYGWISLKYPDKAIEIKTGSFNTVAQGNYIFVESTGHGAGGEYHNLVKVARDLQRSKRTLTQLDFKYHFYPWWMNPKYALSPQDAEQVVFTKEHRAYFAKIEKQMGCKLGFEQKAWYIKTKNINGEEMLREFPSTDDEPFLASLKGAYFAEQMAAAREQGRISRVPHEPGLSVDTWWDLGLDDTNAIWFLQTVGRELRFIRYEEEHDQSLEWYIKMLGKLAKEHHFHYRHHVAPHDMVEREYTTRKSRLQTARRMGINFVVAPQFEQQDQIDAARNLIPMCWFDEENCGIGITHLEMFRRQWNEKLGMYLQTYLHDAHSHAASAFMTGAMMIGKLVTGTVRAQAVQGAKFAT